MTTLEKIRAKLTQCFTINVLEVRDESHLHAGHVGHREGVTTHIRITISAKELDGKSRVQQHRLINEALTEFMNNPIHAMAIEVLR